MPWVRRSDEEIVNVEMLRPPGVRTRRALLISLGSGAFWYFIFRRGRPSEQEGLPPSRSFEPRTSIILASICAVLTFPVALSILPKNHSTTSTRICVRCRERTTSMKDRVGPCCEACGGPLEPLNYWSWVE
jgi:hypothetical protein